MHDCSRRLAARASDGGSCLLATDIGGLSTPTYFATDDEKPVTPERYQRIRRVLDLRQPDLTVLMDNVHKPHNLSAIIRSCDAVGVMQAHGVWCEPGLEPLHHTSGGSSRWVSIQAHDNAQTAVQHLHCQDFTIYAANVSAIAVDYRECDYTRPSAILLGAELTGVSEQALELADQHVVIPMTGMVESLNVSVAAAVILFEAQRQRLEAGLYETSRMRAPDYQRNLFEWLHPKVAAFCRAHSFDYPGLDAEGEVVDFPYRGGGCS